MINERNKTTVLLIIIILIISICAIAVLLHRVIIPSFSVTSPTPTQIQQVSVSPSSTVTIPPVGSQDVVQPGEHCGGFIRNAKQCIKGYHCQLGRIPDKGGICVAD